MPDFDRGLVVRVPFPYTDRPIRQRRPALVVSEGGIGQGNSLLWVAMITSAEHRAWPGDVPLGDRYGAAGLPAPSIIRPCKLATIESRHAEPLGHLEASMVREVMSVLRGYLERLSTG